MGTLKNLMCWSENYYLDWHGKSQNLQCCPDFCIFAQTALHIGGDGGGCLLMVVVVVMVVAVVVVVVVVVVVMA